MPNGYHILIILRGDHATEKNAVKVARIAEDMIKAIGIEGEVHMESVYVRTLPDVVPDWREWGGKPT